MNPIRSATLFQQKSIQSRALASDCYGIFNLLTSDTLFEEVEAMLPEHRERMFPPTETLSMFITQALSADRSCQNIVNQAAMKRLIGGLTPCSTHTGGYCRARQRLPLDMMVKLTRYLSTIIDNKVADNWRWKGRKVKIVDGTTITMPDTESNQAKYPQPKGQKVGLGFPICRIVGITCLSSGALLNAVVGHFKGKGGDEQTLLRSLQDSLIPGDLVLGDAYFPTYFFIADMQSKGVDLLMEQNGSRRKSTDFRQGQKLGERDHIITIFKPKKKPDWMSDEHYRAMPDRLNIREFKAGGKIMVTTMICPKSASKNELKLLYKSRWNVELDIRDIKTTMGMNVLSCKTPDMILKEIWIYLLAYNLIRLMMIQSALMTNTLPRTISFKHSLQLWLVWIQQTDRQDAGIRQALCLMIAQQRVANRPGRIEPRAVKRRPKPYPLLTKPRHQARVEVIENGHPKKLK
jgi:hypothetical protein